MSDDGVIALRGRPAGPRAAEASGRRKGIGRSTSAAAEAVSDGLRRQTGAYLDQRRRVAACTLVGMGSLAVVASYQFGLVRHLPEPPFPGLDADRVDASGEAYRMFSTPDAALGLASSAVTLVLVGMGGPDRASKRSWVPLLLAAKVIADATFGLFLTVEQASKHRRFCSWCLVAAAASVTAVPFAIPEAAAARRKRRGRG